MRRSDITAAWGTPQNAFCHMACFARSILDGDASGTPAYGIGTTSGLDINLEECVHCGISGWGWRDDAWGTAGVVSDTVLQFPAGGTQTIRVQTREDGVMVDHIVLSSAVYRTTRPGSTRNDTTILPRSQ